MDNAPLVRHLECLGNLQSDRQRHFESCRPTIEDLRQVLSLDQFHDEEVDVLYRFEGVDPRNMRMVEGGQHLGLALEPRQALRVLRYRLG